MAQIFSNVAVSRTLLILILCAGVFFFIGFVVPVLAALIICFASWPLYNRLLAWCNNRSAIAASIAICAIILGLVIPLALVFSYAMEEIRAWIEWLKYANEHGAVVPDWLKALPGVGETLAAYWQTYLAEPHQLAENIRLLQLGRSLFGLKRFFYLWDVFDGIHVGVELIVKTAFESAALAREFTWI